MTHQHRYTFRRYCGAYVCENCEDHRGLARCYCGWSTTRPSEGAQELAEMGENLEEEERDAWGRPPG